MSLLCPSENEDQKEPRGWVFDIQRYSINDGPGIRTTVFFKSCPLVCSWCSNPESQEKSVQLLFFDSLCAECYRCVSVCPTGATSIKGSGVGIEMDRGLCSVCGLCIEVCPSAARVISGRLMTTEEVMEVVKKDALFYRNSGGGLTASGGEPTAQPKFLLALFKACWESAIHTTLDTCGYVRWGVLKKILEYTDLVLFDIKHMDPERHIEFTGMDNRLILQNAERIVEREKSIRIRMPLIPEYNDSEKNIGAVIDFVTGLGIGEIDLLPYHRLGITKYKRLGKAYELINTEPYQAGQVENIRKMFESSGVEVSIV